MKFARLIVVTALVLVALPALAQVTAIPDSEQFATEVFIEPDGMTHLEDLTSPVPRPPDAEELKALMERVNKSIPVPVSGLPIVGPEPGSEMLPPGSTRASSAPAMFLLRDTVYSELNGTGAAFSNISEVSAANDGRYIFATGNWWAGRSTNQGANWTYVNPYTFSNFCCDQDVVYDPTYDMFIWYRQASVSGTTNQIRFSTSVNDGASWCHYTLTSTSGEWFDYPHLALTEDSLVFTTNQFSTPGNSYLRSRVYRYPLSPMTTCSAVSGSTFSDTGGTMTPAQGGITYAYIGQHRTTSTFRIYRWLNGSGSVQTFDRTIPTWTAGSMSCPGPTGVDWCARADHRPTAGLVRRHPQAAFSQLETVGFFWNADQGGGFPAPYINNAWFYTNSMAYGGREFLWFNSAGDAAMYAGAAPNRRGNTGLVFNFGNESQHPRLGYCKDDYTDGQPPAWGCTYPTAAASTSPPSGNTWGDYNRVRCFEPRCTCWLATGHIRSGGASHPIYAVFGQGRDFGSCFQDWATQP